MKKALVSAFMMVIFSPCFADDVPSLIIKGNGTETNMELSGIKNIKFTENSMVVNLKDGTEKSFSLDDITIVEFGTTASTIKDIIADSNEESTFCIANANGNIIIKGQCKDFKNLNMSLQRGLYIITSGKTTKKILVK